MKPFIHAELSVRKYGGIEKDYQRIHDWFDQTKAHHADMRHRAILHNSWGIFLCEQIFGTYIRNSDGKVVQVRDIAEDHVLQDLGRIPALTDVLSLIPTSEMHKLARPEKKFVKIKLSELQHPVPSFIEPDPFDDLVTKEEDVVELEEEPDPFQCFDDGNNVIDDDYDPASIVLD